MSANKPNIQQIQDYLNGKLDARAMHKLEREAQDDPMLWDVMKGMESGESHQFNLNAIDQLIDKRVEQDKKRVIPMWKVAAVAASLLIALGVGGWFLMQPRNEVILATTIPPVTKADKVEVERQEPVKATVPVSKPIAKLSSPGALPKVASNHDGKSPSASQPLNAKVKADTVEYQANAYPAKADKIQVIDDYGDQAAKTGVKNGEANKGLKVDHTADLLKKLAAMDADTGSVMHSNGLYANRTRKKTDIAFNKPLLGKVAGAQVSTLDLKSRVYTQMVTGQVFDKDNSEILPGASVKVEGASTATQTDAEGKFAIAMPAGKEKLNIGYVGYNNQQVTVNNRDSLKVNLSPNSAALSEVVVTGYGAVKTKSVVITTHPANGQKAYDKYLQDNATMPDGRTGTVKLSFMIGVNGAISNITVIKGLNDDMNQKAILLIKNGPVWVPQSNGKAQQVSQDVVFHK